MAVARTIALPRKNGASWDDLTWPPKYPSDVLTYLLDATVWLAGGSISIVTYVAQGATVLSQTFATTNNQQTGVVLEISGGVAGVVGQIGLLLVLTDGEVQHVLIELPIKAELLANLPPAPDITNALSDSAGGILSDDAGLLLLGI